MAKKNIVTSENVDVVRYAREHCQDQINVWTERLKSINNGALTALMTTPTTTTTNGTGRKRRRMSAEARKRIGDATRKRWAEFHKTKGKRKAETHA